LHITKFFQKISEHPKSAKVFRRLTDIYIKEAKKGGFESLQAPGSERFGSPGAQRFGSPLDAEAEEALAPPKA